MKPLVISLLGASLVANVLLFLHRGETSYDQTATASTASTRDDSSAVPEFSPESWHLAAIGDPAATDRLRAIGLPDSIIRTLIVRQIDRRYRDREKALNRQESDAFWRHDYPYYANRSVDPLAALDLRREKSAEKKRLLADLPDPEAERVNARLSFLSPEKREAFRAVREDYDAMRQAIRSPDGIVLPEEREKLAFLEKQERADLEALLSPDELAAYELRHSNTARQLRYQLRGFDATEDEYKAIYRMQREYLQQHAPEAGTNIIYARLPGPAAAREKFQTELKATLGEERYSAYERAQDQEFRTLAAITSRLDLPPEKAIEAHALKTALERKAREFRPVPGISAREQQEAYLAAIAEEAEASFTAILGEKGYAAYKEYGQLPRRLEASRRTPNAQR